MRELRILSGGAANGLVNALGERFRQASGLSIVGDFGAVGVMRDRVLEGEAVDLVILTRAILDQLSASGHVQSKGVVDLGQVVTGIAVRDGTSPPDISNAKSLREAFLSADAIYLPDMVKATAGIHVGKVLETLAIADRVRDRLRAFPNGQTAMAQMVASKDANPIGCTQITEILNTPGVQYAGDLPAELGLVTTYTAGVSKSSAQPEAAALLIQLLTAPEHAQVRTKAGFSG